MTGYHVLYYLVVDFASSATIDWSRYDTNASRVHSVSSVQHLRNNFDTCRLVVLTDWNYT